MTNQKTKRITVGVGGDYKKSIETKFRFNQEWKKTVCLLKSLSYICKGKKFYYSNKSRKFITKKRGNNIYATANW